MIFYAFGAETSGHHMTICGSSDRLPAFHRVLPLSPERLSNAAQAV